MRVCPHSKVEFHDGDRIVVTAERDPWQVEGWAPLVETRRFLRPILGLTVHRILGILKRRS